MSSQQSQNPEILKQSSSPEELDHAEQPKLDELKASAKSFLYGEAFSAENTSDIYSEDLEKEKLAKLKVLLDAAQENIEQKIALPFLTIAKDSQGENVLANAFMTKIINLEENIDSKTGELKNINPQKPLSLNIEIVLGSQKVQPNEQHLKNLELNISLNEIQNQIEAGKKLSEILASFTNLVLTAMAIHQKQPAEENIEKPDYSNTAESYLKQGKITVDILKPEPSSSKEIDLHQSPTLQESTAPETIVFSGNSGQIFGQIDIQDLVNQKQTLAESSDQKES